MRSVLISARVWFPNPLFLVGFICLFFFFAFFNLLSALRNFSDDPCEDRCVPCKALNAVSGSLSDASMDIIAYDAYSSPPLQRY